MSEYSLKNETVEVKVDTSELQKRLDDLTGKIKVLTEKLAKFEGKDEFKGKGVVESNEKSTIEKVVEALKAGSLREQWTTPIDIPSYNRRAGLRDFVITTNVLTGGKPGDTVNIPYVKDFDFDILTSVGGSLTEKTNLVGSISTTIVEVGAYTQVAYSDIEKYGNEILGRLERVFANAAIRAENRKILDTIIGDADVSELDKTGAGKNFDANWIVEALSKLMQQGKEVKPEDCVLCISPAMHEDLLKDIVGSQPLTYARPEPVRTGFVGVFMGVKILIPGYLPEHDTTNHYLSGFLIHKNAVVLAPKRELLIETERDTVNRKIKITGTHTFAAALVDNKAVVEIKTASTT
ncbi:MAG: hypothetical protein B6U77_00740 [Candidatus Hecatellales archaeon ex4484_218]|nr:MAG: hypothetical protein B6U77_00740 [Candidatus Hecatellales archaeon ex4484_218]